MIKTKKVDTIIFIIVIGYLLTKTIVNLPSHFSFNNKLHRSKSIDKLGILAIRQIKPPNTLAIHTILGKQTHS